MGALSMIDKVLIRIRDLDRSIVAHQESIRIKILNLDAGNLAAGKRALSRDAIRGAIEDLDREYRERSKMLNRYLDLLKGKIGDDAGKIDGEVPIEEEIDEEVPIEGKIDETDPSSVDDAGKTIEGKIISIPIDEKALKAWIDLYPESSEGIEYGDGSILVYGATDEEAQMRAAHWKALIERKR